MASYFSLERRRQGGITVIPIHDDDHWSLLVYLNAYRAFYTFDSYDAYHHNYVIRFIDKLGTDDILVSLRDETIVAIPCPRQRYLYECGQYVFMFVYSFFTVWLDAVETRAVVPVEGTVRQQTRRVRKNRNCPVDLPPFNEQLQSMILEKCKEKCRGVFITALNELIHERRKY